jgi:hypothetical protein
MYLLCCPKELIILTLNVLAEASATGNQVIANVLMATKEKLASELRYASLCYLIHFNTSISHIIFHSVP